LLGTLANSLREHLTTAFEVTWQGTTWPLSQWLQGRPAAAAAAHANVRDLIDAAAAACLAPHFEDLAPEYPTFSVLITNRNRPLAAQDALRWLKGTIKTQQGGAVLDAPELLDGERLVPENSRYARYVLDLLASKGEGQVLNRAEVLQEVDGVEYLAPERFRLEPELVAVVLAALVYNGDAVIALPGKKLDAAALETLFATPLDQLARFRHVERPREWNLPALRALFELVGLGSGRAQSVTLGDTGAVQDLQTALGQLVAQVVVAQQRLQDGIAFWGRPLLSEPEQAEYRTRLEAVKVFLKTLQPYNTPGKLKNFRHGVAEIEAQRAGLAALRAMDALQALAAELGPAAAYLSQAELALPAGDPWTDQMRAAQAEILGRLRDEAARRAPEFRSQTAQQLQALKAAYRAAYLARHARARLGQAEDRRKAALLQDPRVAALRRLATIDLLPVGHLRRWEERLTALRSCLALTEAELEATPVCPHCGYQPATEPDGPPAATQLSALDEALAGLLAGWTATLLDNLEDPMSAPTATCSSPTAAPKWKPSWRPARCPSRSTMPSCRPPARRSLAWCAWSSVWRTCAPPSSTAPRRRRPTSSSAASRPTWPISPAAKSPPKSAWSWSERAPRRRGPPIAHVPATRT
jgi:hypothetical protein